MPKSVGFHIFSAILNFSLGLQNIILWSYGKIHGRVWEVHCQLWTHKFDAQCTWGQEGGSQYKNHYRDVLQVGSKTSLMVMMVYQLPYKMKSIMLYVDVFFNKKLSLQIKENLGKIR